MNPILRLFRRPRYAVRLYVQENWTGSTVPSYVDNSTPYLIPDNMPLETVYRRMKTRDNQIIIGTQKWLLQQHMMLAPADFRHPVKALFNDETEK